LYGIIDTFSLTVKVCAIIGYSVGSIEQYPSNILWTVLRNFYCMLAVFRNINVLWTVLRYIRYIMLTILRNVCRESRNSGALTYQNPKGH